MLVHEAKCNALLQLCQRSPCRAPHDIRKVARAVRTLRMGLYLPRSQPRTQTHTHDTPAPGHAPLAAAAPNGETAAETASTILLAGPPGTPYSLTSSSSVALSSSSPSILCFTKMSASSASMRTVSTSHFRTPGTSLLRRSIAVSRAASAVGVIMIGVPASLLKRAAKEKDCACGGASQGGRTKQVVGSQKSA